MANNDDGTREEGSSRPVEAAGTVGGSGSVVGAGLPDASMDQLMPEGFTDENPSRQRSGSPREKVTDYDSVDDAFGILANEKALAHRCFLLWAMQAPDKRNARAAGRAVGRADGTVRQYRRRYDWDERVTQVPLPVVTAQATYRALYYPNFKMRELVEIEDLLEVPFLPDSPIPRSVGEAVSRAVAPMVQKTDSQEERERGIKRKHLSLVDGAIGMLARQIAAGAIKASLRDLPILLELREEIRRQIDPSLGGGVGILPPVESIRVAQAKAAGGDILEAMLADAQEMTAILSALVAANQIKAQMGDPAGSVVTVEAG